MGLERNPVGCPDNRYTYCITVIETVLLATVNLPFESMAESQYQMLSVILNNFCLIILSGNRAKAPTV
jgi:hypothetical protein